MRSTLFSYLVLQLAAVVVATDLSHAVTAVQMYIAYEMEYLTFGNDKSKLTICPGVTYSVNRKATLDEFLDYIQQRDSNGHSMWGRRTNVADASNLDNAIRAVLQTKYDTRLVSGARYRYSEFGSSAAPSFDKLLVGTHDRIEECVRVNGANLASQKANYQTATTIEHQERLRDSVFYNERQLNAKIQEEKGKFVVKKSQFPNPHPLVGAFKTIDVALTIDENSGASGPMLAAVKRFQHDGFVDEDPGTWGDSKAIHDNKVHYRALLAAQRDETRFKAWRSC